MRRGTFAGTLRGLATGVACALAATVASGQTALSWGNWSLGWKVGSNNEGLELHKVNFGGQRLIAKISLPVMRVFYENKACGPYADRLGGTLSPIPWANNATVVQRQFTLSGRQWYEIGIRDQIGSYDIYQAYYLSSDGLLDAHIYSKGLQCVTNHVHYPNWRIDFDLDTTGNNVIERQVGGAWDLMRTEFDAAAASATNHQWRVRNISTGTTRYVLPGFADFTIPDTSSVPVTAYDRNAVFGRRYRSSENGGWTVGPNKQVPYGNGESLASDLVFWYEGYMPHLATDGSALWHSTGVRISPSPGAPPPAAYNLVVQAAATLAAGVGASMDVHVNGTRVASRLISATSYQDYGFQIPALGNGDRVDLVFTNDGVNATEDRNLYVNGVTLNGGRRIPSTAATVTYDTGSGASAFDGFDVRAGSALMDVNGALRFTVADVPGGGANVVSEIEPNGSYAQAQPVPLGSTVTATLSSSSDNDYVRISVPAGRTVTVRMTPPPAVDYDLELFDANGTRLRSSVAGTGAVDAVSWANASTSAVTVYARVYYYRGGGGTYMLEVL